jgi:hypothetical protein
MTNFDDKYMNIAMPNVDVENVAIDQVDSLFKWLGRAFGLVAIMAAVGYVVGGML